MTDKEYVMANWDWAAYLPNALCVVISDKNQSTDPTTRFDGPEAAAWSAAAEFTRERLEQIRQLEADLKWVKDARVIQNIRNYDTDAKRRTIARLESALADLKRGMKA